MKGLRIEVFVFVVCVLTLAIFSALVFKKAPEGVRESDHTCRDEESLQMRDDC